jgi:3-dehydroquinate synthase
MPQTTLDAARIRDATSAAGTIRVVTVPSPSDGKIVRVNVPGAAYDVNVRPGLLSQIATLLRNVSSATKAAILTDSHVAPKYLHTLSKSLESSGFFPISATIPAGESHKSLQELLPVYEQFLGARIERATPVIGLGGGVIGDMAGFVAATILRGVPLVQIPTTLLAMVDASVGGKTGVNTSAGKNLVGAFHQPTAVFIDPEVLKTLPPRELRGGLAECIKHEIIRDAEGFARLERSIDRALSLDIEYLIELIAHNVAIKAAVVAADPFEKAERAHLNFGHTFGHAIEKVSNYEYSHGESVALGMIAASFVAVTLGMLDEQERRRMIEVIGRASMPTHGMKLPVDQVLDAMAFDKKAAGGKLRFVLPDGIGRATVRNDVPIEMVRDAITTLT